MNHEIYEKSKKKYELVGEKCFCVCSVKLFYNKEEIKMSYSCYITKILAVVLAQTRRFAGGICSIIMFALLCALSPVISSADEVWTMLSDFDKVTRPWLPDAGPQGNVCPTNLEAHSGKNSLAITPIRVSGGKAVRAAWYVDTSDLKWSLESRIRFWLKGNEQLAHNPSGGVILVEAGGGPGGAESHWMIGFDSKMFSSPEWQQFTLGPIREAYQPGWNPDADGKIDPARIVRLLFVIQQDAQLVSTFPFTFYIDDIEVSHVQLLPHTSSVTYKEAKIEIKPQYVTPIERGFRGRKREHPPLVTFTDITGWRVAQFGGTEATMVRSEEKPCYEDLRYQAKLTYRSKDGTGHFELIPPRPIPIKDRFNAVWAWVYGNTWAFAPTPNTPPVNIWLRIADSAGQIHRIDLGMVNFKFYGGLYKYICDNPKDDSGHIFWGGPADGKIHFPAQLEAIEVHGGVNSEPRTIYLESIAVYQDNMELPTFRSELIEKLPFPTTPDTILPTIKNPTKVVLNKKGDTFVFTVHGDETIIWRYTPTTGTLSDLTVEVAGRHAFQPCAGGGPVFLLDGAERKPTDTTVTRRLLSLEMKKNTVRTRWRVSHGQDATEYVLTLTAKGKSLIADWSSKEGKATALRLGVAKDVTSPKLIRVPYMNIYDDGPAVLLTNNTFFLTLLDWYNTESSAFFSSSGLMDTTTAIVNGGSIYNPLTDGSRNRLGERQFINVSSYFEEVLPNIPNPPSTQAAVTRTHLYTHVGYEGREGRFNLDGDWMRMWRLYHRKGIEKLIVTHHEDVWSNDPGGVGQGAQEYTMTTEAAPDVGDEKLKAYCSAVKELGYYVGLYENFIDYSPNGKSWDERNTARTSSGEMMKMFPPTYGIRPLKALEMALDYPRRVRDKFGVNAAYRDRMTADPPWFLVDYQAGSPGAGKFATTFKSWGALLLDGAKAYGGPVFSEGGSQWFYAGLVDGNYGQTWTPDLADQPLLLDFDLLKIHPLEADISMRPWWLPPNAEGSNAFWKGLSYTIAYGHIGFLPCLAHRSQSLAEDAYRYYYLIQQLQSRYVMIPVAEIKYHQKGQFFSTTEALKTNAHYANQVYVRYTNGLEVAVNYNAKERWTVKVAGKTYDLSSYGWAAAAPDGFVEYCTEVDSRRISYVDSPVYRYADASGKLYDFGPIATDGALVIKKNDPRGLKLIPLVQATDASKYDYWPGASSPISYGVTTVSLDAPDGTRIEAFDAADKLLGTIKTKREGKRLAFRPVPQAEYYIIVQER